MCASRLSLRAVFLAVLLGGALVLLARPAGAQFPENKITSFADEVEDMHATDVDGDGDTDVLSASQNDDKIAWYENDGSGSFTTHTITTDAGRAMSVFATDVDGDGHTDILSASFGDDKIAWYENDGSGSFTTHTITTSATDAVSVFAADVDGDGDTDVLSASEFDEIAWYENDGSESFTAHTITATAEAVISVYATDVDGDGDTDVLSASQNDDKIAWYENDGSTNPSFTAHTITTTADAARRVYATDVDGDGDTDVLSASHRDDKIAWYENDGASDPSFTTHTITTGADGASSVYATDVDGDGDTDVLSAFEAGDKIAWYENDGSSDPSFTTREITTSADGARSVFARDIDGDSDTDVLSASQNDDEVDEIAWYENDGASPPSFATHLITTDANGAKSVFARDVDGDGHTDVLSASFRDDKVAWYENDGNTDPSFTPHTITTGADGAESVFAADLDGDGDTDALSASLRDDKIAWYENDGASPPSFTAHTITTSASWARSVFARDVDGDGHTDVLSASENDHTIAWYENDGSGSFTTHTITTSATDAKSVFARDVDGDGDTDVLSASAGDDKIAWYENDGSGSFTTHTITTSATDAESVFARDVDGDGHTDVLSASFDDDKIIWYENDGASDPSFTAHTITTFASGAQSVFATDIDGDSDTDILSASSFDDKIAWYENDGNPDPSFTSREITANADGAGSVYAADVDGDSDTDVLSASDNDDKIAWYENDVANAAPTVTVPLADISAYVSGPSVRLQNIAGAVFSDPDGDDLTVGATSGNPSVVDTEVQGPSVVMLHPQATGTVEVTLTASDGAAQASTSFNVTVESGNDSLTDQVVVAVGAPDEGETIGLGDTGVAVVLADLSEEGQVAFEWHDDAPSSPSGIEEKHVSQYRFVLRTEGGLGIGSGTEVRLSADELGGVSKPEAIQVYSRSTPGSGTFSTLPTSVDDGGTPNDIADDDIIATTNSFSEFVLASNSDDNPLPVELARFDGTTTEEGVRLNWQTASEENNAGFEVQRKATGREEAAWTEVGFVDSKAEGGTTNEALSYRHADEDLPFEADRLEYRLRQVDLDGTATLTDPVEVERTVEELQLDKTFPNPARGQATVRFAVPEQQEVSLELYDVLGRQVRTVQQGETQGRQELQVDLSGLSSGTYFLRLTVGGQTRTRRLTVVR